MKWRSERAGEVALRRTRGTGRGNRLRAGIPWLLIGAICAFVLTVFVPPVAAAAGLGLVAVALVRRRADAYGMFAAGFAVWIVIYIVLAIFAALTAGDSSGSSTSYDPGLRP